MLATSKIQNFLTGFQKNIPLTTTICIFRKSASIQRSQVVPSLLRILTISFLGYCVCSILFSGKIKVCNAAKNNIRFATTGAQVVAKGSVLLFIGGGGIANKRSCYQKNDCEGTTRPFVINKAFSKFSKNFKYNTVTTTTTTTTTAMKAWSCHGRNQQDMVHRLHQAGIIRSEEVYRVMSMVDRKNYFPSFSNNNNNNMNANYYEDTPNSIGYGQTISAPHMHAYVLEEIISHLRTNVNSPYYNLIHHKKNSQSSLIQFLDVGCGSGYITACFGRWLQSPPSSSTTNNDNDNNDISSSSKSILGLKGYAYGIDIVPELVKLSTDNIMKQDSDLLNTPLLSYDNDNQNYQNVNNNNQSIVSLQIGNGYHGLKDYAPYDIIHVGAAATTLPKELCQQLKVGGLLIVPIDDDNNNNNMMINTKSQTLYKIERLSDKNNAGTTTTAAKTTDTSTVSSSSSSFDPTEYRKTALLGVRYVPLVQDRSNKS